MILLHVLICMAIVNCTILSATAVKLTQFHVESYHISYLRRPPSFIFLPVHLASLGISRQQLERLFSKLFKIKMY